MICCETSLAGGSSLRGGLKGGGGGGGGGGLLVIKKVGIETALFAEFKHDAVVKKHREEK
jgi:hypothetical protein